MSNEDPENPTHRLVEDWLRATQEIERIKSDLNAAECRMHNAENALGKRLAPIDMEDDEEIGLWVQLSSEKERLVIVRRKGHQSFKLRFRKGERA